MSRDTGEAQPDSGAVAVEPAVLDSLHDAPVRPTGEAGGLAIWRIDTDRFADEDLDHARVWLDDEERAQASTYVRAELRHAYELAHVAARLVMGEIIGVGPEKVVWGRHPCPGCGEPHGRPRAEGTDLEFSVSHTPGQVLVAVADTAVGVDVEQLPDDPVALSRLLHPRETEEVEAAAHGTLDGGRAPVRFIRAWARTEAYLKGLGIGLGRDPHLDYLGSDEAPGRVIGDWRVLDVVVPEGYGAAVALHRG